MEKISFDMKKGIAKVKISSKDDLWYLSHILDVGDLVSGSTERKIKIGDGGTDRNVKVVRKRVFMEIRVEKIELTESLKVLGTITKGPEDVAQGSYHSFFLNENEKISIIKNKWLKFQLDKLNESFKDKSQDVLIVVFDREEAFFAKLTRIGIKHLTQISGNVQKKDEKNANIENFYEHILVTTEKYIKDSNYGKIIFASPAFWKDELSKNLKDSNIKQMSIFATCSSVDKRAFGEVIKRPEVMQMLKDDRTTKEVKLVERLFGEISKEGNAAYGIDEVRKAVDAGAVEILLVCTGLIKKMREDESYEKLDEIMKLADSMRSGIVIVDSDNEGGKKLDGLGGIGAILRYKL